MDRDQTLAFITGRLRVPVEQLDGAQLTDILDLAKQLTMAELDLGDYELAGELVPTSDVPAGLRPPVHWQQVWPLNRVSDETPDWKLIFDTAGDWWRWQAGGSAQGLESTGLSDLLLQRQDVFMDALYNLSHALERKREDYDRLLQDVVRAEEQIWGIAGRLRRKVD